MSNKDNRLQVAELDFDTIKNNLRIFLSEQAEFSDYNFEGSGMSVLLDILAYNTHYMGYYMNMVANEMFIDSAVTRDAVVSHAKLLGYTPRSRVASQATINVAFNEVSGGSNSVMTLPRFTRLSATPKDGQNFIFATIETQVAVKENVGGTDMFRFNNLKIKEGRPASYVFPYNELTNSKQVFELPDVGIDISTLNVVVQKSPTNSNTENYVRAEDATEVSSTSRVFYVDEIGRGRYQIYFGDNIIGKKLDNNNLVACTYLITSGADANGIRNFRMLDNPKSGVTPSITTVTESSSGRLEESIESIKFTAPKSFVAQNRAVTKNDYIALINKEYPYFDSVTVWGGEENVPKIYGKIFFSVKPRGNYEITASEIDYLKESIIKPISVLTVTPEYIAPDYNFLNFNIEVIFDQRKTRLTLGEIKTRVYNSIVLFADQYLDTFNNTLKLSRLSRVIDDADPSIESNTIKVVIEKRFRPTLNQSRTYKIDFHVPIKKGTATDRLYSEPSFEYYDEFNVLRTAFIEEVPLAFSGIDEIEVTSSGSGYTSVPEVIIEGDGKGAAADVTIVNGKIKSIRMLNAGSNYSSATARLSGGGGSGAIIKPILQGKKGQLRIFYYDSNNIKKVIVPDAGTVFYQDGYVELKDFNPVTISDPFGTLVLKAVPNTNIFKSIRNSILTLDSSDPGAVQINLQQIDI